MEKTKKRSFTQLKEIMTYEQLKEFCKRIANEYARSSLEFARSYFMIKYDITASCFYKILETAVVCNWISDDIVDKMEQKALSNQKEHYASAGLSTHKHYAEMRLKRQEYIISSYEEKKIEDLVTNFAYSSLSKKDFAEENDITVKILDLLLKKAIVELIVDDIVFNAIWERSVNKETKNKKRVEAFFIKLAEMRNSKLEELLSE